MRMTAKNLTYTALMVLCLILSVGPALAGSDKDAATDKAKETVTTKPEKASTGEAKDVVTGKTGEAAAEKEKKDLVPGSPADELSRIYSDNRDFRIRLRTVDGRRTYRIGDTIAFEFKTNRDGYVTIIDVGTSGRTHVLFPNRYQRENFVEADRWYRVPGRRDEHVIRVEGPTGINYIKAIATLDRHDWFSKEDLITKGGAFSEVKDPNKIAKDLGLDLRERDRKAWTEDETNIRIVRKRGDRWDDEYDRRRDRWDEGRDRDRDRDWTRDWDRDWDRERDRYRDNFLVKLWTERESYRVGDPLRVFFYAEKDCYLNLIDFGTSGEARVIFPNRYQRDNFIRGGTVVEIPGARTDDFKFTVGGPSGTERLKAVATRNKLKLYRGSYEWDKYVFQPWEEKSELVYKDIKVRLDDMKDDDYVTARTKFRVRR